MAAVCSWSVRWDVHCVERTASTNSDVLALARAGAPVGTVIRADHQTAGRGRLGRTWEAPPGSSLLASLLLPAEPVPFLAMARVALAVSDACLALAGVEAALKWPNDLLVDDRKLAGLLAESDQGRPWVVVGIGCNVAWPARDEPAGSGGMVEPAGSGGMVELGHGVTSLARQVEADRGVPSPGELLDGLLALLAGRLDQPADVVLAAYRARCATLGQEVRVTGPPLTLEGRACAITPTGELELAVGDARVAVRVGDVVHVRAR
jgi:BirA family biotin operon repressor/biotin-[acetyl-CoA-carboxylase] ligase